MRTLPAACLFVMALLAPSVTAALPAFPGAQGYGADTPGGRGGRIILVTNLNDSGPGSLREACSHEGPRTVVFRVGGTILLKSHLRITEPFITIAGQTAPGGGILLRDAGIRVETHDVLIRFLRVRVGASAVETPGSQDALAVTAEQDGQTYNVVIDHCSLSWAIDENASTWGPVHDVTFQWCIISECLLQSSVRDEPHSMGILLGKASTRTSLHHSLFAHNRGRNPRIQAGVRDVVNNTFYNYGWGACQISGDPNANLVGNYWRPGPDSNLRRAVVHGEQFGSLYVSGNISPDRPREAEPEWAIFVPEASESLHRAANPFETPAVAAQLALSAYHLVLAGAGATVPCRDDVDMRIVRDVRLKSGRLINDPSDVGGFPDIAVGEAPADSDRDGMPDEWEKANGLDPDDASDSAADSNSDGYTNLEEYLNELAGPIPG